MINKGIEIAKINKCGLIQLTSNKKRKKAINFYKKLGFFFQKQKSFKLDLFTIFISNYTRFNMNSFEYMMKSNQSALSNPLNLKNWKINNQKSSYVYIY